MFITPALYIILGLSLGVGITLVYLQERFVRERRTLISLNEAEKVKSAEMLKELDAKWEQESRAGKEEPDSSSTIIKELEEAVSLAEQRASKLEDAVKQNEEIITDLDPEKITDLESAIQEKENELNNLQAEKGAIKESLEDARMEITDLQAEIDFFKGEIESHKKEKNSEIDSLKEKVENLGKNVKNNETNDDFLVLAPGSHYLPGSVARALMGKKKQ